MSTPDNNFPHEEETGYGWKFLTPWMTTQYEGQEFAYPAPALGEKWSEWITHPNPAPYDGQDCGPGRLHVMNHIDARYAPNNWWIWFVQWQGVVGKSNEKTGAAKLRLRRVLPRQFWRMIRLGWCKRANLRGANLTRADLTQANLTRANLTRADLTRADLTGANLTEANLTRANLTRADLTRADLTGAYLTRADLTEANLRGADLTGANLRGANLTRADLTQANLTEANLTEAMINQYTILSDSQRALFENAKGGM